MIVVPLYDTLARNAISYIVNQGENDALFSVEVFIMNNTIMSRPVLYYCVLAAAGIEVAVVAGENINLLLQQADECPGLKYVISTDKTVPEDIATLAKEKNIELRTFDEVLVSYVWLMVHVVKKYFYQDLGRQNLVDHQVGMNELELPSL